MRQDPEGETVAARERMFLIFSRWVSRDCSLLGLR
jgi:hypothetical protein